MKKEKWVKDNQGQLIITAGQVVWTNECEKALADPDQAKSALRHLKKKWISYLNKLTAITCSKLTKIERNKVSNKSGVHSFLAKGNKGSATRVSVSMLSYVYGYSQVVRITSSAGRNKLVWR